MRRLLVWTFSVCLLLLTGGCSLWGPSAPTPTPTAGPPPPVPTATTRPTPVVTLTAPATAPTRAPLTATPVTRASPIAQATEPAVAPVAGGGRIAFVRDGDLWVLDLARGLEGKLIESTDSPGGRVAAPRWSADGRWVLFERRPESGARYLWVVPADGGDARQLSEAPLAGAPAWSPAESRIAYATVGGAVWLVDADGAGGREILAPGSGVKQLAWSPDGQRLALERWEDAGEGPTGQGLWLINSDGSELTELYSAFNQIDLTVAYLGPWSPDGERLAFWQGPMSASLAADGSTLSLAEGMPLYVLEMGRDEPRELGSSLLYPDFVAWSPDGRQIVLAEGSGREVWGNKRIVVFPIGFPGDPLNLSRDTGQADTSPAWSPDGRRIAYVSGPSLPFRGGEAAIAEALDARHIWVADVLTTERRPLTGDPAYAADRPLWSADGGHILFVRRGGEQAELWLMRSDGGEQRRVVGGLAVPSVGGGKRGYYGYFAWEEVFDWYR